MPDRATHLARQLLERARAFEASLQDGSFKHEGDVAQRRRDQIAKVLAVQAGITDGPTIQLVASALPTISLKRESTDREREEFADFLRRQVRFD